MRRILRAVLWALPTAPGFPGIGLDVIDAAWLAGDSWPLLEHVPHFVERHLRVRLERGHPFAVELVQLLALLARHRIVRLGSRPRDPGHPAQRSTCWNRLPTGVALRHIGIIADRIGTVIPDL